MKKYEKQAIGGFFVFFEGEGDGESRGEEDDGEGEVSGGEGDGEGNRE